jgi:CheY-like chemotaxis protein/anti-sigma regulatory factor (Ser/Thr protein kinase)
MAANFRKIVVGVERAKELVRQILTFSRKEEVEKKPILLAPIVKETFKMLRASIPSYISMELFVGDEALRVLASPTQIQQLVMNLCVNARDALPKENGFIKVALLSKDGGKKAVLKVMDNGHGIPEDIKERIFEPYFTTKPRGKGTGLGLSIVYGIVKDLAGDLFVESEPGKGSVFMVEIPCIESRSDGKTKEQEGLPLVGKGNVIVVDDEPFMVEVLTGMLSGLGYQVTGFTDPCLALDEIKKGPAEWDLMITDLAMPKMPGTVLIKEVKAIRRDLPVLLMSGVIERDKDTESLEIEAVLMKPITEAELSMNVSRVLGKRT